MGLILLQFISKSMILRVCANWSKQATNRVQHFSSHVIFNSPLGIYVLLSLGHFPMIYFLRIPKLLCSVLFNYIFAFEINIVRILVLTHVYCLN